MKKNAPGQTHRRAPRRDGPDGLLLVDKPKGWTSHDVVAKIRGHFRLKKVGHGGTLDPMATGLLVILLGRGTKLSDRVMGTDKTYEGTMLLGQATDSHDADGEVTAEADPGSITEAQLKTAMDEWVGDVLQTPPMVSAIKKDGVPLYKMARKGQTVERKARMLHIYSFRLLEFTPPRASFRVECTKGTYVRTLAHDVGQALGCGAHLVQLCRTKSGPLSLDKALSLDEVLALDFEQLGTRVTPAHEYIMGAG